MMSCSFSLEAYCKIILHAEKYSTLSVCGLLFGVIDSSKPSTCMVTDVVPVCHYSPSGPLFDMTADLVCMLLCRVLLYIPLYLFNPYIR